MKIELIKDEPVTGGIYYLVKVDGITHETFVESDKDKAYRYFEEAMERYRTGFPKREVLGSFDTANIKTDNNG